MLGMDGNTTASTVPNIVVQQVCPTCGHCPTCGRPNYAGHPHYPYQPYPFWYSSPNTSAGPPRVT